MDLKKIVLAAALLLATTSISSAQRWPYHAGGDYYAPYAPYYSYDVGVPVYGGIYDYAPGYYGDSGSGYYDNPYRPRGGPGPRVGNGTGMGIGAYR